MCLVNSQHIHSLQYVLLGSSLPVWGTNDERLNVQNLFGKKKREKTHSAKTPLKQNK